MDYNESALYINNLNKNNKKELSDLYGYIMKFDDKYYIPAVSLEIALYLNWITSLKKPENVLEIGFGSGSSSIFILKGFSGIKKFTSLELDRNRYYRGLELFKVLKIDKINLQYINAFEFLNASKEKYDLVFIDAAKNDYIRYLEIIDQYLLPEGLLICDNILFGNKVLKNDIEKKHIKSSGNMKLFNQKLSEDKRFETYFLNIGDGLSVSKKII